MVHRSISRVGLVLAFLTSTLLLSFNNCSSQLPDDVSSDNSSKQQLPPSALVVAPAQVTIQVSTSVRLVGSGGTPPYTFALQSGSGQLTADGTYVAPSVAETAQIQLADAKGQTTFAVITVTSVVSPQNLTITYTPTNPTIYDTVVLATTGGTAPYTYSVASGGGTISSGNRYIPDTTAGATTVQVNDAQGRSGTVTFTTVAVSKVEIYKYVETGGGATRYGWTSTAPSGFTQAGVALTVFGEAPAMKVTVYKCPSNGNGKFISTSANCLGAGSNLGVLGYLAELNIPNTTAYKATATVVDGNGPILVPSSTAQGTIIGYYP